MCVRLVCADSNVFACGRMFDCLKVYVCVFECACECVPVCTGQCLCDRMFLCLFAGGPSQRLPQGLGGETAAGVRTEALNSARYHND